MLRNFLQAQTGTVTGTVSDSSGSPVAGVSVTIKGTSKGTSTDNAGRFNLAVSQGAILVFSSLNYIAKEVSVAGQSQLNVSLTATQGTQLANEVVVIGYGTARTKRCYRFGGLRKRK